MLENPTGPNFIHMPKQIYASQTHEVNFYKNLHSQAFQNNWIYHFWIHKTQDNKDLVKK
mgnify:CR=1 FL=1